MLNLQRTALTLGLLLSGVLPVQAEARHARACIVRITGGSVERVKYGLRVPTGTR